MTEPRTRCRRGLKAVGKTCVPQDKPVTVTLSPNVSWHVGYAAQAIQKQPQAIREAVAAGRDVVAALKRELAREEGA